MRREGGFVCVCVCVAEPNSDWFMISLDPYIDRARGTENLQVLRLLRILVTNFGMYNNCSCLFCVKAILRATSEKETASLFQEIPTHHMFDLLLFGYGWQVMKLSLQNRRWESLILQHDRASDPGPTNFFQVVFGRLRQSKDRHSDLFTGP